MSDAYLSQRMKRDNATGSGNIAYSLAKGVQLKIHEVRIHLSAAGGANNLTAKINDGVNAVYDLNLITQDMTSVVDLLWQPSMPVYLFENDSLDIAWTNGSSRTYGIEVVYEQV